MTSTSLKTKHRIWTKDNLVISTDPSRIPISKLNEFFARDDIYWASPLPTEIMQEMLHNCLCFGLYETQHNSQPTSQPTGEPAKENFIGIGRCITDFATFMYLTDVYIDPQYQGKGLGTWMMECVLEIIVEIPYLRRTMLVTGDWKRTVPFYEKVLDMELVEGGREEDGSGKGVAVLMGKGKGYVDWGSR